MAALEVIVEEYFVPTWRLEQNYSSTLIRECFQTILVSEYVSPVILNIALRISFTKHPGHRSFACGGRTFHV